MQKKIDLKQLTLHSDQLPINEIITSPKREDRSHHLASTVKKTTHIPLQITPRLRSVNTLNITVCKKDTRTHGTYQANNLHSMKEKLTLREMYNHFSSAYLITMIFYKIYAICNVF